MLKWIAASSSSAVRDDSSAAGVDKKNVKITSDPLATINFKQRNKSEIYSVNRVNPLFSAEVESDGSQSPSYSNPTSSSSGYGSNPANIGCYEKVDEIDRKAVHVSKTLLNSLTEIEAYSTSDLTRVEIVPSPVWPQEPPESVEAGPRPTMVRKLDEGSDTFPRNSGNVALQVQRLSVQLGELRQPRQVRNPQYVTKLEVQGTKSDILAARDFRAGGLSKDARGIGEAGRRFDRDGDQRSSLRSEPALGCSPRSDVRSSLRSLRRTDHIKGKRRQAGTRSSRGPIPRAVSNPQFVKKFAVHREPSRSWPGAHRNYSDKSRSASVPSTFALSSDANRCFSIRHQRMDPIGEETERGQDSIVTNSLLQMTSFSSRSPNEEVDEDKQEARENKEDMDRVINELSKAVMKSKGVSTLTRAVSKARRSQRRSSRRSFSRRRSSRTSNGTLRKGARVEAVKDLWEKSGMKTNGRKLLIESEDEGDGGRVNLGYESDMSEESVPTRVNTARFHRKTSSQSSCTSCDSAPKNPGHVVRREIGGSWELRGERGLTAADLETESDSSGGKHVRFSNRSRDLAGHHKLTYDNIPPTRWVPGGGGTGHHGNGHSIWEKYYGSTAVRDLGALESGKLRQSAGSNFGSGFTLDQMSSNLLRKNEKKRKKLKCFCQFFCVFLLLSTFLLVIVAVSILLTRGKNHFGSI